MVMPAQNIQRPSHNLQGEPAGGSSRNRRRPRTDGAAALRRARRVPGGGRREAFGFFGEMANSGVACCVLKPLQGSNIATSS